ncbi:MAG: ABC transporter substrate-binding protein [Anaerolineae bacterium]
MKERVTRRRLLRAVGTLAGITAAGAALAACGATPTPQVIEKVVTQVVEREVTTIVEGTPQVITETVVVESTVVVEKEVTAITEAAELKIGGWFDKGTQETVNKQLSLFSQQFPNVNVSVVVMEFEVRKSLVMFAAGTGPDVFWVNNDQTAPWASRNVLHPLDDLVDRDGIDLSDFHEVGTRVYSYNGTLYGIPEYLGNLMLLVNPLLFETAGVPLPPRDYRDPSWTLDALLETSQALTKRPTSGPAEQYGLFISTSIGRWYPILWDFGGDVMDDAEHPTSITFDSSETREAIQWVADLRLKHGVTSSAAEAEGMPDSAQFTTGKLAMWLEGPWYWPLIGTEEVRSTVPWEVFPLPKGPKGQFTRLAGDAYGIWSGTKHVDLAWELCRFVTIGEGAEVFWAPELCKGMPATKSLSSDPRWGAWFTPESKQAVIDLGDYAGFSPMHPNWAEVSSRLSPPLDQVWIGQRPIDEAVQEAQAEMEAALQLAAQ